MEMFVEVWSRLPAEILERVLSFLPVPVLCRLRTVCTRWNSIAERAKRDEAIAAIVRYVDIIPCFRDQIWWKILDLEERRLHTIKHQFIGGREGECAKVCAQDGGFDMRFLEVDAIENLWIEVSSPNGQTVQTMPISKVSHCYPDLTLVADDVGYDNILAGYKIFLINRAYMRTSFDEPVMRVYESGADRWRMAANPSLELGVGFQVCTAMFQGLFYALFSCFEGEEYRLLGYDVREDAWQEPGLHIHGHGRFLCPKLIVNGERLFVVDPGRASNIKT